MSVYKIKHCKKCDIEFLGHIAKKLCNDCHWSVEEQPVFELICPQCKTIFFTYKTNKRFCTRACRKAYHSDIYYKEKEIAKNANR